MILGWRAAVYFELWGWARAAADTVITLREIADDSAGWIDWVEDNWADGSLDAPLFFLSVLAAVAWLMYTQRGPRASSTRRKALAEEEDSGSGSESGHSVGSSDDDDMKKKVADLQNQLAAMAKKNKNKEKERSDSDSENASTPKLNPDDPAMKSAADAILKRLQEHERLVNIDRALGTRATRAADHSAHPAPKEEEKPGVVSLTSLGIPEAERLKETLRDPRERVIEQLQHYKKDSGWSLPPNISEKVAPALLLQIFSSFPSTSAMANRWIQEKQLERNHVAHEMVLLSIILDKSLLEDASFASSESCEIVCRRIYALKKAFESVKCQSDWKQPKGASAQKWKSKVRWDLANEIDIRALIGDTEALPTVDKELQNRLKEKALMNRYIENVAGAGAVEEDS